MCNNNLLGKDNKFLLILSKYYILLIAVIFLIGLFLIMPAGHYAQEEPLPRIIGDGYGYYYYIPFYIIDFQELPFERLFSPSEFEPFWNKYQIGEAVMMLPFFLLGHLLSAIFNNPLDGYSFFYQYTASLAGLFYVITGIFLLKKILERYFSKKITLITLTVIIFGTNLYHFGTLHSLFSHGFSFFLFCSLIYFLPLWMDNPRSGKLIVLIGIVLGFILLVRMVNIALLIFVFFYQIYEIGDIKKRFKFYYKNYKSILLIFLIVLIMFLPQIITWKLTYNQWFVYSYGEAGFHFQQLYISNVLFSLRRGLLFWSPILCFSLFGFWFMRKEKNDYLLSSMIFIPIILYINSSFDRWWFGAAFGHRGFTEFLPIFAIAIAVFYSQIKNRNLKIFIYIFSSLFVIYSIFQMIFWWNGWIPQDLVTLLSYKNLFIKIYSIVRSFILN